MGARWPMLQPLQHTVLFSRYSLKQALQHCGFADIRLMNAHKTLTPDYLIEQIRIHNPTVAAAYDILARFVPGILRRRPISLNIGEVMAVARV